MEPCPSPFLSLPFPSFLSPISQKEVEVWFPIDHGSVGTAYRPIPDVPLPALNPVVLVGFKPYLKVQLVSFSALTLLVWSYEL